MAKQINKLNRRNFIQASGTATAALLLSPELFASSKPASTMDNNFKLKVLATNWGFNGTIDEYCAKVKKEGYDGIEIWWQTEKKNQDEVFAALKKYDLEVGFLTAGHESDFKQHFQSFTNMIDAAANNTVQKPLYINCHSGRDYFTFEQGKAFIEHTTALRKSTGIKICHETHRSRLMYAAPVARHYLESVPE